LGKSQKPRGEEGGRRRGGAGTARNLVKAFEDEKGLQGSATFAEKQHAVREITAWCSEGKKSQRKEGYIPKKKNTSIGFASMRETWKRGSSGKKKNQTEGGKGWGLGGGPRMWGGVWAPGQESVGARGSIEI